MEITLTGALAWIFKACVLVTSCSIILLGTWIVLNMFIWEILVRRTMMWLGIYSHFAHFIIYHKRYLKWAKKYEGGLEEGADDIVEEDK